jgi:hypothetical protein
MLEPYANVPDINGNFNTIGAPEMYQKRMMKQHH